MLYDNEDMSLVTYNSIDEFHKVLTGPIVSGRSDSSQDYDSSRWSGTKTYEESYKLLRYGDTDSLDKMRELKLVTDRSYQLANKSRVKFRNDVVGFSPIVPNAIMGLPKSMINSHQEKVEQKVVDVMMNHSWGAMTDREFIDKVGAATLSAIDYLENNGVRVNLYVGKLAGYQDKSVGHMVKIKRSDQPLNLLKIAYYIANSAFLRRTAFKIDEAEPRILDVTHSGYGRATETSQHADNIHKYVNDKIIVIGKHLGLEEEDSDEEIVRKIKDSFGKNIVH